MSDTKLYARLRVKTGEYGEEGNKKNRYSDVGVLFASEHFNNMFIQLETLPLNKDWDGRIYVNPIESEDRVVRDDTPMTQHQALNNGKDVVPVDIDDKPIDLSEIPF